MWLFLGLLGSISVLSASDLFAAQDADQDTEGDAPDAEARHQYWSAEGGFLQAGFPDELEEPIASGDGGQTLAGNDDLRFGAMGLHDHLGLRIHSSDMFPAPPPAVPDILSGDDAADLFSGSGLGDSLYGNGGNDTLLGAAGDDWLDGGDGDDSLVGGEGADTLLGGNGNDSLIGGAGNDLLRSGSGANTLLAGDGDDTLIGAQGGSFLNGGAGNDLLQGAAGNQMHGGEGDDTFALSLPSVENSGSVHILDYSADEDVIQIGYDPALGDPEVTITHDPDLPDQAQIWVNGQMLATVANAGTLSVSDLSLVAQDQGQPD